MQPRAESGRWAYLRRNWINVRRRRFWLLVVVLAYTLVGFLGLPLLAERLAVAAARDYSRELRVETVRFNPYTLALEIRDLALHDVDGARLVGFDRLFVDFTLASAWKGAWTFEAIHVDGLDVREERFASGTTRLAVLADTLRGRAEETAAPAGDGDAGGPPPVLIEDLRLREARLQFRDRLPGETAEFVVAPIDIRIDALDTRPERSGRKRIRLALGGGGRITWQGELQLVPLQSRGRVTLEGIVLDPLLPYLRGVHSVRDFGATLDASFDYAAGLPADGPRFDVTGLEAALRGLSVTAFEPATEFLSAEAITVADLGYSLREQRLDIGSFAIDEPVLRTWLKADGEPALLDLLPPPDGDGPADDGTQDDAGPADGDDPLSLRVDAFRVNGLDADLADRSFDPGAELGLRGVDLAVDGFELAPGTAFDARIDGRLASGGEVGFDGRMQVRPRLDLAGDLRVQGLRLAPAEPYLRQFARVRLAGGALGLAGRIASTPGETLAYTGNLGVQGLDVRTAADDEPVLGWQALRIDELEVRADAGRLRTSTIDLQQPFARVAIAADRSTNIGRLLVPRPQDEPAADGGDDAGGGFDYTIGGIALAGGELDFADRSLPLPFATRVHGLDGRISTLASGSAEAAQIGLEGQVADYGLARIDGAIDPARPTRSTDIRMEFRNLLMPDYSPYAAEFAGRRIASGRMDLDLDYRIDAGALEATNSIVLTDLQLGDKVDNPDAIDLPLGLAVALLKDGNGVIDVELPVTGNVNDPEFRIGGVIASALATLIKKIVSSPFRLLGSLVGLESGELDRVEFLAGRSDLTPPQRERVDKLAEALAKRPQLVLVVTGAFAPDLDRPALQREAAVAALRKRLAEAGADTEGVTLTDAAARDALRSMFVEAYPDADLAALRERFTRVLEGLSEEEAEDAEPEFDPVAFQAHLADRVIAAQPVDRAALAALANARARAVRERLAGDAGAAAIDPERVRLAEPAERSVDEGERVALELSIDAR